MNPLSAEDQAIYNRMSGYSKVEVLSFSNKGMRKYAGGGGFIGMVTCRVTIGDFVFSCSGYQAVVHTNAGAGVNMPSEKARERTDGTQPKQSHYETFRTLSAASRALITIGIWSDPRVQAAYQEWTNLPLPQAQATSVPAGIPGIPGAQAAPVPTPQPQAQPQAYIPGPTAAVQQPVPAAAPTGLPHNDALAGLLGNAIG